MQKDNVCVPCESKNTGLIPPSIAPLDFIAGAESAIVYSVRVPDGDWKKYKPTDECQRKLTATIYDTSSCVTFSALNSVESQIEYLLATKQIPQDKIDLMRTLGYFDANGKVNFSDHFTANMSGTTSAGNTLQAVWESIRKDGVLPQLGGYKVEDFNSDSEWFDRSKITDTMKTHAKKFLEIFNVQYEWAIIAPNGNAHEEFAKHLKQAPLHVATPTCASWGLPEGSIVTNCGDYKRLNHATLNIGIDSSCYYDLDHYNPFIKKLALDYYIPYAMKGLITLKVPTVAPVIEKSHYQWTRNLSKGMRGEDVTMLQKVLIIEVPDKFKVLPTGYFGDITFNAVISLQEKYTPKILKIFGLSKGTGFVGVGTRTWLNLNYK